MTDTHAQALEAEALALSIKRLLAGHDPGVQGAVLADLLATFLAGHHESLREPVLKLHMQAVRALIEPCLAELREFGFPR